MLKKLLRKNIASLAPYSTARDEYQGEIGVYLDANENPYDNGFNRYPDPYQSVLKEKISRIKGVDPSELFIGNGSDEPIDLLYRMFCDPGRDNVVAIAPTYGMYRVAAAINDVEYREVQLNTDDFSIDVDKLLTATDERTKMLFICSPNNPTANAFGVDVIEQIIARFGAIVVIDEAYIDFSRYPSFVGRGFDNVVVLQTMSKARAMAGLRLGLSFAPAWITEVMTKVKYPYNINVVTQKIVLEQLDIDIDCQVNEIISERDRVISRLSAMKGIIKVFPSDSNFVLVRVDDPRGLYGILIDNGVIVRDRSRISGCEGCLRITIGTPQENDEMIRIIGESFNSL